MKTPKSNKIFEYIRIFFYSVDDLITINVFEYLNVKVIVGYGLMFLGMFCCIFGYSKSVTLQAGSVMESIGNLWVMILSFLCFREPLTRNKILGNLLIIAGIVIFNLF